MKKEADNVNQFIELRAQGLSYQKIANQLGISRQTLIQWSKEFQHEIANLRAIELEELREKYYLNMEHSIKLFGERFLAIRKELIQRDFKDVPTEKLEALMLKYKDRLDKLGLETIFEKAGMLYDVDRWKA